MTVKREIMLLLIALTIRYNLRDAAELSGFSGVMYTTWQNQYDRLEAFAECVKAEWKKLIVNK